jgi:hypothetical protein
MPAYAKRLQQSSGWVWCFGVGYAVGRTAWAGALNVCMVPAGSIDQRNTACSLSAGVSKPKVFRGR